MKKRGKFLVMFSLMFFLTFMVSAADSKIEPLGISPGNDLGMAIVQHNCPTFSWTSVDWATGYKLVVFRADSAVVFTYGEISALQTPVLQKMIRGKALAWTPSSIEGLAPGMNYLWYVQAMDEYGTEVWSSGRSFRVELPVIPPGVEEELKNRLKEHGLSDENLNNVFAGVGSSTAPDKTNEVPGEAMGTEGTQETFYGYGAGNGTSNGDWNSCFGTDAGDVLGTSAYRNGFFGHNSGASNTTGDNNVVFGYYALSKNIGGSSNSIFGYFAGHNSTVGNNHFMGHYAGYLNTTGTPNTFIGVESGRNNTTGNSNTFLGYQAGYSNTTSGNVFVGHEAGRSNTSGTDNVYMGYRAGYAGTTGNDNTIIGDIAGQDLTTGYANTLIGGEAGENITTGYHNTIVGQEAGDLITTGTYNTCIGEDAGGGVVTGGYNVFLGANAGSTWTGSNKLFVDNSSTASPLIEGDFTANTITINGNLGMEVADTAVFQVLRTGGCSFKLAAGASNAQIGSQSNHGIKFITNNTMKMRLNANGTLDMADGGSYNGTWNDASSIEFKENIREISSDEANLALEELNPVIYNYKKFKDEKRAGFIAEHVPEIVSNNDRKNLSAMDIVAVLTKVVKEQQKAILELKDEINELKKDKK